MRNLFLRIVFHLFRALRPKLAGHQPPRTVLVLQYAMPLGCCVHGTPLYAALKAANPGLTLIVASRGLGRATLAHDPHIDHLLETSDPVASLPSLFHTSRQLRKLLREPSLHPDLILQDASNRRGLFALFALLLRLAPTAGFAQLPLLYDHPFAYDPNLSLIDNDLRLPALLGPPSPHLEPAVYFTESELANARALLLEANPGNLPLTAFVMQGSGGQRTGWHDDRFAAVIQHAESLSHRVIFLGTATDAPTIDRIRSLARSTGVSLAGRTSIPELAAALCLCDLLITLDTGTMHVGRSTNVPMAVLGPSWQKPLEWLPLHKPNVRILRGEDRDDVPPGYLLDEIEAHAVIAASNDLLHHFPPSAQARAQRATRLLSNTRA